MTRIDWKMAFNLFFDRGWLRLAAFSLAGFFFGGILGAILFGIVTILVGSFELKLCLLCSTCGGVVGCVDAIRNF